VACLAAPYFSTLSKKQHEFERREGKKLLDKKCVVTFLYKMSKIVSMLRITWVISKVLHTVCFLFKNEFVLQNAFIGLKCNLHCAL
jgi:hypothetical protein